MGDTSAPFWLDKRVLEYVLQSVAQTDNEVEVISYKSSLAESPGHCSKFYRVGVNYTVTKGESVKFTSLLVKTPLDSGPLKAFLEGAGVYDKEVKLYSKILPVLYQIRDASVSAKSYYCHKDRSLVLEDLIPRGYVMKDRLQQLDYDHCQQVMRSLATLHALSVAAQQRHPGLVENVGPHMVYNNTLSPQELPNMQKTTSGAMMLFAGSLDTLKDCAKYAELIRNMAGSFWFKMIEIIEPGDCINVLNHGDSWTNNIMFKYDDTSNVSDAKLIDFQACHFSSFAFDLYYFVWSSVMTEVRQRHREELFEEYRETFNKLLGELDCDKSLEKEDFDREMKRCAPYLIHVFWSVLPAAMEDQEKSIEYNELSTEEFQEGGNKINLQSKYFKDIIPKMLQDAESLGVFE